MDSMHKQMGNFCREIETIEKSKMGDFPCGAVVKNPSANAADSCSSPGPGRSHMPQSN